MTAKPTRTGWHRCKTYRYGKWMYTTPWESWGWMNGEERAKAYLTFLGYTALVLGSLFIVAGSIFLSISAFVKAGTLVGMLVTFLFLLVFSIFIAAWYIEEKK